MIGSQLGQYQIVEQIGAGAQATVYRAYQPSMARYVAVKVIPRHFASDPTFVDRFRQEATLVASLEHPHILPVYDFGEEQGVAFISMRMLEAGTLKDILSERSLPISEASHLMCQLASALNYAHGRGVVHRDIKPANIMIDREGNSYLTDFGVAKVIDATGGLTASGTIGTPAYMSPEQGMAGRIDGRSDIYALGVLLHALTTGRLPYVADSGMSVILMHLNEPVPMVREHYPDISPEIEQVIATAMAKEPDDRYQNANAFCDALNAAVGVSSASVEPVELRAGAEIAIQTIVALRDETAPADATPRVPATSTQTLSGGRTALLGIGALLVLGFIVVAVLFATGILTGILGATSTVEDDPAQTGVATNPPAANVQEQATNAPGAESGQEPTAEPQGDVAVQPTAVAEPVLPPSGELPFIADFEASNALEGWLTGGDWQIVNDLGNHTLFSNQVGSPLIMLANGQPQAEWLNTDNYFISMRVKLAGGGAARLLFSQSSTDDFYSLDFSTANVILERVQDGQNTIPQAESTGLGLEPGRWYDLWVWRNGQHVSAYVNGQWLLATLDLVALPPGTIGLETTGQGGVFIDDLTVSVPHPASEDFEGGTLPDTWTVPGNTATLTKGAHSTMLGGRNLDTDDVEPITEDLSNFTLICEVQASSGQGAVQFRKGDMGFYEVQLNAGNATLIRNVNRGNDPELAFAANVYGGYPTSTIVVETLDEHINISVGGQTVANLDDPAGHQTGTIALAYGEVSDFLFDDCIIVQPKRSSNAAARFVTDLWESIFDTFGATARPQLADNFDGDCGNCWIGVDGGTDGPPITLMEGDEPAASIDGSGAGSDVWWLANERLSIFTASITTARQPSTNYIILTDVFLESSQSGAESSVWVGARAQQAFVQTELDQLRVRLMSGPAGNTATIESAGPLSQQVFFEGPWPAFDQSTDGWHSVMIAAQGDDIAFFVNGTFLSTVQVTDDDRLLGPPAIGVSPGSVALFDNVEVWDLRAIGSPNRIYRR